MLALSVFTYGTGKKSDLEIKSIIEHNFDLRPGSIIRLASLSAPFV